MIKYNNNTINDWNFGTSNLIKVYRNNAIVFYKVSGESPTPEYQVCFAVVDDISQYTDREFEDVYDNATEKWYKLNNLNEYEEYGLYGSGRTICENSSRLPQGYTEVTYVENTTLAYLNTGFKPNQDTRIVIKVQQVDWGGTTRSGHIIGSGAFNRVNAIQFLYEIGATGTLHISWGNATSWTDYPSFIGDYEMHTYDWNKNSFYRDETLVGSVSYTPFQCTYDLGLFHHIESSVNPANDSTLKGKIFFAKIYDDGVLVRDLVPCKRDNDGMVGMYDIVNDVFHYPPNYQSYQLVAGESIIPTDCVTTYKGKLTIDEGYEYEWNGSSWVNLGEVSGSTATLPNVPFTVNYNAKNYDSTTKTFAKTSGQLADKDVTITTGTPTPHDTYVTVASGTRGIINGYGTYFNRTDSTPNLTIISKQRTDGDNCHLLSNRTGPFNYNWMYRPYNNKLTLHGNNEQGSIAVTTQPVIEGVRINSNRLVTYNNYTDKTSSTYSSFNYGSINGDVALFAAYTDTANFYFVGDFYWIYMSQTTLTDAQVQQVIDYNEGGGGQSEYPKYYSDKTDPLNNLIFNTLEEAQTYAYNNCVYDGMKAIIDGDRYYFDSTDENGWVKVTEYYIVEDVTPNGASGWTISGSSTYNPDSSYYDDFDLETTSTSTSYKIAKVTIYGYDHFTYYLRSYHGWASTHGYVMATNVDEVSTPPSTISYNSASAITNTYTWSKLPKSAVNLSNYRRVTYNNLDKTVEHTFYVYFYGRTYGSYVGNATILIPKEQTNENWEQVTFSASSNVASYQKNLYIDNNNSTSGGTNYWYSRWIVGLPSGSHSSYTNYSSYDYCPTVTSSTFTSVAGEQRQVNFTYDGTTSKSLSFRLTDGSNVLTPSDTVYYNMALYNACNALSSSSNLTFPRNQYVKVGGSFEFTNSSNRHYIYGYQAPALGTRYYVDNYQSTFDIVYTKLSEEAVTITYTTYDPNDVETPAFNTDITYPYSGGTTSSTTLTSYNVPYTYPYRVIENSGMFSANAQSYTANQAARTIDFTLYPNNREFASVADLEAYAYAWEGMKANVGDTKYVYENGQWVEKTSKDSDFVIGDFNTFISSSTEVTEGYYIIYSYTNNSSYANKNSLFSWNSGNTWNGNYTLGNMNHRDSSASTVITADEIIDDAVWQFIPDGNGNFYIRNVSTNKYWNYLGTEASKGVPLTDNPIPVNVQNWQSCLAFVERQSGSSHPLNKLYGYNYRYGWYANLATDGNNQYYMRKYVP